jgi:hypothetical protein
MKKLLYALITAALVACATATPQQKLGDAFQLLQENRPIPAEALMKQALEEFKAQGSDYDLGVAQFMYGQFLRSKHFTWQFFRSYYPNTDTQEQRDAMAKTYFLSSRDSFRKALSDPKLAQDQRTGYLWREYLANIELGDKPEICASLKSMKASNDAYQASSPGAKVYVPAPYKTFDEFTEGTLRKFECNTSK